MQYGKEMNISIAYEYEKCVHTGGIETEGNQSIGFINM